MRTPSTRTLVAAALVAATYFVAARFGLLFAAEPGVASTVWLPAGISLFAALTWGPWVLPGVFAGSLLAHATGGAPLAVSLAIATGATAEAALGLYLLRRFVGAGSDFRRLREVVLLLALGGVVPSLVSATADSVAMGVSGLTPWTGFATQFGTWWLGDMGGVVIVTPLLISLRDRDLRLDGRHHFEVVALVAMIVAGSLYVFREQSSAPLVRLTPFLLMPVAVWIAMRLNRRTMTLIMALIAGLSIYGAVNLLGAYALGSVSASLMGVQLGMIAIASTGLLMVATVYERSVAQRAMTDSLTEMERRVEERTANLSAVNAQLSGEMIERLTTEAALRESETKFRAVFEGASIGIAIVRRDGTVRDANPVLEAMCGVTVAQIPDGAFINLVLPQDRGPIAARFTAMSWTPGETTDAQEARFVRPDGTLFWGRYVGRVIEHGGEPVVITMIDDVTIRKEAEAALTAYKDDLERTVHARTAQLELANRQLVEATEAKDRFLAGMSHELRTPLNSILGFTGVMRQGLAGPLTEEQERQLDMVKRSGRHLLALVDEVLDITRIEAGQDEVRAEEFELRAFVIGVADGLRPLADERGIEFSVEVPDTPTLVRTDEGKLRQILINIVGNSLKFCESGSVELAAASGSDGFLRFTIEDTGPGIPERDRPFVFDAFYQGSVPDTAKAKGTGLGLAISRNLATTLGGDITFVSVEGEGTTFVVRIAARLPDPPTGQESVIT